ncbi:ATP-binding protein [Nonomuraea basaltis]|uniref:ATP-binding protein n=1 Tax=Nonomuraea basaltis TaxID=2495887 RepID=UPI001F111D35|nr:AAA family ATPase [Nonomuraea basaltis]
MGPTRQARGRLSAVRSIELPPGLFAYVAPKVLAAWRSRTCAPPARAFRGLHPGIKAHRQVTAVGPGGVGKTRLALAVAAEVAGEYSDGVWFVDLVPVTDPDLIATAVAGALGLGEQPGRDMTESVLAVLADRHALLVLDNCEHVVDGLALFLERLLATCPRVTVLATSRARLMVPFERVHPVPPLSLAVDGDSDAVALFMERAAAVGWPLDPPLRDQIASICERLDGMALAIELAAARYPTLGLDGITAAPAAADAGTGERLLRLPQGPHRHRPHIRAGGTGLRAVSQLAGRPPSRPLRAAEPGVVRAGPGVYRDQRTFLGTRTVRAGRGKRRGWPGSHGRLR